MMEQSLFLRRIEKPIQLQSCLGKNANMNCQRVSQNMSVRVSKMWPQPVPLPGLWAGRQKSKDLLSEGAVFYLTWAEVAWIFSDASFILTTCAASLVGLGFVFCSARWEGIFIPLWAKPSLIEWGCRFVFFDFGWILRWVQPQGLQAKRAVEDCDTHYSGASFLLKQSLLNPLVGSKQAKKLLHSCWMHNGSFLWHAKIRSGPSKMVDFYHLCPSNITWNRCLGPSGTAGAVKFTWHICSQVFPKQVYLYGVLTLQRVAFPGWMILVLSPFLRSSTDVAA